MESAKLQLTLTIYHLSPFSTQTIHLIDRKLPDYIYKKFLTTYCSSNLTRLHGVSDRILHCVEIMFENILHFESLKYLSEYNKKYILKYLSEKNTCQ